MKRQAFWRKEKYRNTETDRLRDEKREIWCDIQMEESDLAGQRNIKMDRDREADRLRDEVNEV